MAIFVALATMIFNLNEHVAVLTAVRFGLLYGAISSTLMGVCDWFVAARYTSNLWQWLSVGWIAWMLWWVSIAYLLSDISGMD